MSVQPQQRWRDRETGKVVKVAWVDVHGVHYKTRDHKLKTMKSGRFMAKYVPLGTPR